MAADGAVGAVRLGSIADRNLPFAEAGNLALDQLLLIGTVHAVAGLTDAALGRFIHMQKMQVLITIAEVRQFAGALVEKGLAIMAVKAEGVTLFGKTGIKGFRIGLAQQDAILCAVRIVTGPTGAGGDRLMLILGGRDLLAHRSVTADTEELRIILQHADIAIAVRTMTGATALLHGRVRNRGVLGLLADILMTEQTECVALFGQHVGLWSVMGIMTGGTAIRDHRMNILHAGQGLLVVVAHETELIACGSQLIAGVGGMDIMTAAAFTCGNRAMNDLLFGLIVMTFVAEVLPQGRQHPPLFALVGVVASGTFAIGNRGMDE